jgi:hypothetical protein
MKIDLSGKRALVTASTSGIGYSIAKGLAAAGAMVIVNGRSAKSVNDAVARLQAELPSASISGVAADLGNATGAAALVSGAGVIDILVNNAGIYGTQDFFETDDEVWDVYWDTNVMSGVRLSRALLPAMVEKGWGRVVFIASESARNIPADMIHYGVSNRAARAGPRVGQARRRQRRDGEQRAAGPDLVRRAGADATAASAAQRQIPGSRSSRIRHGTSPKLGDTARRLDRRGSQHGRLCVLASSQRDHRRFAAGRRRRGRRYRLKCKGGA